jgi:hypothetical protein
LIEAFDHPRARRSRPLVGQLAVTAQLRQAARGAGRCGIAACAGPRASASAHRNAASISGWHAQAQRQQRLPRHRTASPRCPRRHLLARRPVRCLSVTFTDWVTAWPPGSV